jgi:hypothetical protein
MRVVATLRFVFVLARRAPNPAVAQVGWRICVTADDGLIFGQQRQDGSCSFGAFGHGLLLLLGTSLGRCLVVVVGAGTVDLETTVLIVGLSGFESLAAPIARDGVRFGRRMGCCPICGVGRASIRLLEVVLEPYRREEAVVAGLARILRRAMAIDELVGL